MFQMVIQWVLSAIALMIVSRLVPGFEVSGLIPAMMASAVIGFLNATLGMALKVITFPLVVLTFGLFIFVVNGLVILLASKLIVGFNVYGIQPAVMGSVVLTLLALIFRVAFKEN
ncbi:MAG TPA: phage holin family protein [Terracidiphilus sp.]